MSYFGMKLTETFIMILPEHKKRFTAGIQHGKQQTSESHLKKHVTPSVIVARKDILSNTVCKLNPELTTAGFAA